jgi:hypothetical protein
MATCFTESINATDFIGDSLDKINDNFVKLKTVSCTLSGYLKGVSSFGVNNIFGGSGINVTGSVLSKSMPPVWHVGGTRKSLNNETSINRVTEIISKDTSFLKYLSDVVQSNFILKEQASFVTNTVNGFPTGNYFRGGINLHDGRIFFPSTTNNTTSYIYDSVTESVSPLVGFPSTTSSSFWGSVLMADGRVFCIPHNSTSAVIYTPYELQSANWFTTNAGGTYPGSQAYLGGTLLVDGRVLLCPYNTNSVAIYNPVTNTQASIPITTGAGAVYTLKSFYGCCLTYNRKVFFVPNGTTTYWILNAANTTMVAINNTAPGGDAFRGAVTLSNGNVFCVPYNSTYAAIYNPATDAITSTGNIFPGSGAYETGTLLPDGRVFLMPANTGFPGIYNPFNNTLEDVNININASEYYGSSLTVNNRLMLYPRNSTSGMLISVPYNNGFSSNTITNPLFNKL